MTTTAHWLIDLAIITCAAPAVRAEAPDNALATKVDQLFAKCDKPDSPGCAVGIVRNGKLIYSRGFGSANLDYEVPNTPQTIFEIGSASKSFTCACIALLMDQGKIDPNDDLRRFVSGMHQFEPPIVAGARTHRGNPERRVGSNARGHDQPQNARSQSQRHAD